MSAAPRVAIVHDFLSQHGGAERVVLRLSSLYPDAPIYTAFYDPDGTFPAFRDLDVRTTSLQGIDPGRFRRQVLRYPAAFRELDLSAFDAVVVSSSGFAHHVRHPRTVVYCHTPPRFLYAPHTYVRAGARPAVSALGPLLTPLRRADRRAARGAAVYLANSALTASRVRRRYGIDCEVVPPPITTDHLPSELSPLPAHPRALMLSRLMPYKRVDVAVQACRLAGVPLTVVGDGPDREHLEAMGGLQTTFAGRVSDTELRGLFSSHSVLLVPGAEDFGLVPLEANHAGRPVVAFAAGGPRETVRHGENGLLVEDHDLAAWAEAIRTATRRPWSPEALRAAAAPYTGARFDDAVRGWVDRVTGVAPVVHGVAPVVHGEQPAVPVQPVQPAPSVAQHAERFVA